MTTTAARRPPDMPAFAQDTLPGRYSPAVRVLCAAVLVYAVFAYVNARVLHWFEAPDGTPPLWLSHWTEYVIIVLFGIWRTAVERNPYTRKRLAFLTAAVGILWWLVPTYLGFAEPHVGALPGQPVFPQVHTPGTLTFFAVLLAVLLFGRRIVCGWNCPCVGIRETVGFAFRERTLRFPDAWGWRHVKWFFFALYAAVALFIFVPGGASYVSAVYGGFLALVAVTYFGSFLVMPFTGNRFYCRNLCGYGATFGLLNHAGFYGIHMDTGKCIDCRRCEQACDMGIPVWRQGNEHGRVTALADCMGCARCVLSCPTDALEIRDVRNRFLPNLVMNGSHLMKRDGAARSLLPAAEPPFRPASERTADWAEEQETFDLDSARGQAARCIDCGVPGCIDACPLKNRIPEWMAALAAGEVENAAAIVASTSNLPEVCGRLCPRHRLCEGACTRAADGGAVTIGALERFVTEEAMRRGWRPERPQMARNGKSAAIVGAGPAGFACADQLAGAGFNVTVYDRAAEAGGLLTYGAPPFRMDKAVVATRRRLLEDAGVAFVLGRAIDDDAFDRLVDSHDAVFVATGAQVSSIPHIPGRNLDGIVDGLAYLAALNAKAVEGGQAPCDHRGRHVLILGGGDTAVDCARSAVRSGAASVTLAYRRGEENLRASAREVTMAREEGVRFLFHRSPAAFLGEGHVAGVRFADSGDEKNIACDTVITAFGMGGAKPGWLDRHGIATDERHFIRVDAWGRTSHPKVFAGGDNTHGPDLVVTAVAAGRRAAEGIRLGVETANPQNRN